jgi:hypothetical protein
VNLPGDFDMPAVRRVLDGVVNQLAEKLQLRR